MDEYLRTSFFETFIACSPMHLSAIFSSMMLFNFPIITISENFRFYFQFTIQTLPFLFTLFEKPLKNNYYISIPSLIIVIVYVFFSILHFKQRLFSCMEFTTEYAQNLSKTYSLITDDMEPKLNPTAGASVPLAITTRTRSLTMFRGGLYISTGMLIIANELQGFRMNLGKTESFGTGLMDIGIGNYVILMGVVGPSRQWVNYKHIYDKRKTIFHIVFSCGIILLIGFIYNCLRLFVNISYDSADHGREMNIFYVLAITKLCGNILELVSFNIMPFWLLSAAIAFLHETALTWQGMSEVVLKKETSTYSGHLQILQRHSNYKIHLFPSALMSFLYVNRTGFACIPGLLVLYFMGAFVGQTFYKTRSNCPGINKKPSHSTAALLLLTSLLTGLTFQILAFIDILDPPSRRLCNINYDIWMLSIFFYNVGVALVIEVNEDKLYQTSLPPKSYTETIDYCGFEYYGLSIIGCITLKVVNRFVAFDSTWDVSICLIGSLFIGIGAINLHKFVQDKVHFKFL